MAQGPIDYTRGFGSANPFSSAMQGLEAGATFAGIEQQQAARQAKMEQDAFRLEQERALNDEMNTLIGNPNPTFQDYQRVALRLPADRMKGMLDVFNTRTTEQQKNQLGFAGNVVAALDSGSPDAGLNLIRERIEGERNSGNEAQAKAYEVWAQLVERDPTRAGRTIGLLVSQLPGGDKLLENIGRVGTERRAEEAFPLEQRKRMADAESAAVTARFAESKAVSDLQLTAAQIAGLAIDADIKRQNVAIATLNARLGSEGNDLKRRELELKVAEMQDKRDTTARERVGELNAARGNIDNFLNTASRALNTPRSVIGSAAGPLSARLPTTSQSTADFEALIETLGAQSFLSQIPNIKGMGQLSNAEGEKLQSALQSLSLKQSPERLMENIREAQRLMIKARGNIEARYGASPSVPDTPAARTAAPVAPGAPVRSVDDLVRQYTR